MAQDMDADIRVKTSYWEYLLEGLSLLFMTESTIILPMEVKKYTQIVNPLSFFAIASFITANTWGFETTELID